MNRKIFTLAAIALLGTGPAFAAAPEVPDEDRRGLGIGVFAGGLVGAIAGGPPGAVAGMILAGITTDQQLTARRAGALEETAAALEHERLSLLSERISLKSRADELSRQLARERDLAAGAADTALLADGLEFAIGFRTDSAVPPEDVEAGLDALALLVSAVPSLEVHLDGYADPRGDPTHNQALSLARAEGIRARLTDAGVDPERIRVTAHGAVAASRDPQAGDPDGWALQRRVSIRLESRDGRVAANP